MQRTGRVVISVACLLLVAASPQARDVELRSQGDADATGTGFPAASAPAASGGKPASIEDRLTRVENIVDGQMLDVVMRLQSMEREIQVLRGEIELHTHQLDEQSKKQRDLYVVLDQRLQALEKQIQSLTATQGNAATVLPAVPATTPPAIPVTTPIPITATPARSVASAPAKPVENDQQVYQQALDFLYQQHFDKAIGGFRGYIQKFPQGRYAHVSQYWIAEAYYALGQFKAAVNEYQKLIDTYPASPKLAEAMVKMGESYTKLNDRGHAQRSYELVIRSYPGTDEARQAQVLLQKLKMMPKAAAPTTKKRSN
jgi:tol-pal system protein YbgF